MPRINWGLKEGTISDFDREGQYKPYTGPVPQNGVYAFKLKVLKYVAATGEKNPQLRCGLELVPRDKAEKRYAGYFIMCFLPVTDRTAFRYVPLLDAIGVSESEFTNRTIVDSDGNIRKIGKWGNDGKTKIMAELKDETDQNGNTRKGVGYMGSIDEVEPYEDDQDDEDYDDEDPDDMEYDDDEDGF